MKLLLENWRGYLKEDEGETFYHFSNKKFDEFNLDDASDSAIWGKGVYLSDNPDDLSGWGKEDRSHGFLYKVEIKTDQKNIIDMTQPITPETYERIEEHLGRPLADITKEDGIFPFNTLDKNENAFGLISLFVLSVLIRSNSSGLDKRGTAIFLYEE